MDDLSKTEPERIAQGKFRIDQLFAGLLLLATIGLFDRWLAFLPNRHELGPRTSTLEFAPVDLGARRFGHFGVAGAWKVTSDDPRFGGISALTFDDGKLLGLSDSGVLVRFHPPHSATGKADISELPDGPGSGAFKRNRDSEALARDPSGGGWWIAFENHHELWLYDGKFSRGIRRTRLNQGWRANKGVESLVMDADAMWLVPEAGKEVLRRAGSNWRAFPIVNARGRISDAAWMSPGRAIVVERRFTPFGFRNALAVLQKVKAGYRLGPRIELGLSPIDNVEAIAVERLPSGQRLWLMTDDNFQPPLRTLLIALDLQPKNRRGVVTQRLP